MLYIFNHDNNTYGEILLQIDICNKRKGKIDLHKDRSIVENLRSKREREREREKKYKRRKRERVQIRKKKEREREQIQKEKEKESFAASQLRRKTKIEKVTQEDKYRL